MIPDGTAKLFHRFGLQTTTSLPFPQLGVQVLADDKGWTPKFEPAQIVALLVWHHHGHGKVPPQVPGPRYPAGTRLPPPLQARPRTRRTAPSSPPLIVFQVWVTNFSIGLNSASTSAFLCAGTPLSQAASISVACSLAVAAI
ncbi:hypothetical protein QBC33DRAFT_564415 [Phialemonium atrogriseum]|uniref:Uncharacterized protein n=1 Tax=Phialemonium atrogriseum TaxID=1093897 RepID=A0AAJ0BPA1_9PEZI|nr:uncharacterized protein QBC33DRAFT_564415 [Phialemonium atrogriseum]KAK1761821.1 hypothetical protein QBC33DRAFT_564415 [Phialemonium atrogriseum]